MARQDEAFPRADPSGHGGAGYPAAVLKCPRSVRTVPERLAIGWALTVLPACGRELPEPADGAQQAAVVVTNPNYSEHIAPLLDRNCVVCHREGEVGPFPLTGFREAQKRSADLVDVTADRYMPPWLPGPCDVAFEDDRRLEQSEINLLRRWHETGAPEGDPKLRPTPPEFASGWNGPDGRPPDRIVTLADVFESPAEGRDVFRNFVLPTGLTRERFVEAVQIRPGNKRAAHHAILAVDTSGEARRRDAREPGPGFGGMDLASAEAPGGHFLGWTPGRRPYRTEPGMAISLAPGSDLVLQLHLVTTGRIEQVKPQIGLWFTKTPPSRSPIAIVLYSEDIDIPAGDGDWQLAVEKTLPTDVDLFSIYPHAHYLGHRLRADAFLPDGKTLRLLDIADWSFDWQDEYRLAAPLRLPAGTRIRMDYRYDNSAGNPENPNDPPARVGFGERSVDEMGTLTLQVVPTDPNRRIELEALEWSERLEQNGDDAEALYRLGLILARNEVRDARMRARDLLLRATQLRPNDPRAFADLGRLLGELRDVAAFDALATALKLDPNHFLAGLNLGSFRLERGEYEAATSVLEELARRHPEEPRALGALGACYALSSRPADAERTLRQALAIRPEDAGLWNDLGNVMLFGQKNPKGAIDAYRKSLTTRSESFPTWLNIGRAFLELDRKDEARAALDQALQLVPDHPEAMRLRMQAGA